MVHCNATIVHEVAYRYETINIFGALISQVECALRPDFMIELSLLVTLKSYL